MFSGVQGVRNPTTPLRRGLRAAVELHVEGGHLALEAQVVDVILEARELLGPPRGAEFCLLLTRRLSDLYAIHTNGKAITKKTRHNKSTKKITVKSRGEEAA